MDFKAEIIEYPLPDGKHLVWFLAISPNGYPIVGDPVICDSEPTEEEKNQAVDNTVAQALRYYKFAGLENETIRL
jgi:hypothetical protein